VALPVSAQFNITFAVFSSRLQFAPQSHHADARLRAFSADPHTADTSGLAAPDGPALVTDITMPALCINRRSWPGPVCGPGRASAPCQHQTGGHALSSKEPPTVTMSLVSPAAKSLKGFESRKSRCCACFDATKEGGAGQVQSFERHLQSLGIHACQCGAIATLRGVYNLNYHLMIITKHRRTVSLRRCLNG